MTEEGAIATLRAFYQRAPRNEKVAHIHLFGIIYARELTGLRRATIAAQALGSERYATEISKGIKLAKYVRVKDGHSGL